MFKLWNHLEGSCGRIDGFSNLVEALKRRIAKKSRPLANVHNSIRFKPHQSRAGCVGSHWIVGEHDLPHGTRRAVEWPVSFHRHDSVRDHEVDRNGGAQIEDAFLNALPVQDILRPTVSRARYNAEHVLHAES